MKYLIIFILSLLTVLIISFILTSCKVSSMISNDENEKKM